MADDLYPPAWRGTGGTTFQEWTFSSVKNPAAPENVSNPYGDPTATVIVGDSGLGWVGEDEIGTYGTKTGVWDLGAYGSLTLDIPNRPAAGGYKDIWVQVTYLYDPFDPPIITVDGAEYLGGESQVVEELPMFGTWICAQSKWRITPNPNSEVVRITGSDPMGSVIDQVVVDTKCVPEPSAMVSLLAGAVGMLISRRRGK